MNLERYQSSSKYNSLIFLKKVTNTLLLFKVKISYRKNANFTVGCYSSPAQRFRFGQQRSTGVQGGWGENLTSGILHWEGSNLINKVRIQ
jgi:hypothetical protein